MIKTFASKRNSTLWTAGIVFAAVTSILYFAHSHMPIMIDWYILSQVSSAWKNPYQITGFVSPPYITAFLAYAWLPLLWSNAINMLISIIVLGIANWKYKGGWIGLLLIFTSFEFLQLLGKNNIDWIPLLGVMLPPQLGIIMLSVQPQTLAGVGLIWLKEHGPKIFIPFAILITVSLAIWHGWPIEWIKSMQGIQKSAWNASLFPWSIPLGLFMLYKAWKSNDEILAAMATGCFAPYFGIYSLSPVIAIAGKKYRWVAILLWCLGWIMVLSTHR